MMLGLVLPFSLLSSGQGRRTSQSQKSIQLLESNLVRVFPEALATEVQVILPDQAVAVGAGPALPGALPILAGVRVPNGLERHPE